MQGVLFSFAPPLYKPMPSSSKVALYVWCACASGLASIAMLLAPHVMPFLEDLVADRFVRMVLPPDGAMHD